MGVLNRDHLESTRSSFQNEWTIMVFLKNFGATRRISMLLIGRVCELMFEILCPVVDECDDDGVVVHSVVI